MASRRSSDGPWSSRFGLAFPAPQTDAIQLDVARQPYRRKGSDQTLVDLSCGDDPREYVDVSKIGRVPPVSPPPFAVTATRRIMPTAPMPTPVYLMTPPTSPVRYHSRRYSPPVETLRRPHTAPEWRAPDRWDSVRSLGDDPPAPDPVIELREVDEVLGRVLP